MVKHLREELTYQGLLAALRRDIRLGHFPPGARLKVAELARRYRTSAMPVRQALLELQAQGLVSIPANRGASVRIVDEQLAHNLCDLRKAILGLVVRRFVEHATQDDIDTLEALENRLDAAVGIDDHMVANDLFFDHVLRVAGNPEAAEALDRTWPLIYPAARHFGPRDLGAISRNHRGIIAAARRGDAGDAVALAQDAVEAVREHLVGKIRAEQAAEQGAAAS
ncbi:GntR family transcriptional regulator [Alsobacter sp. SYSU M60028]|uniref:GntR family transcriptional regulator n=1 Tax=Alsobacter ponti TaxID=2962936 RepID=A0ABT1LF67_9HYPH|nr:GntR family transcriptional regulator [Alsobacter ponti]MCP8940084.1 GntR family transcriptional regulator [Alsobacter ponti]